MNDNNYSSIQHPVSSLQSGYALLIAVLVSGLILAMGLGLLSIVEKKIILSSTTRESERAFYAADSGAECALFWDRKYPGFTGTPFAETASSRPPTSGVSCDGEDIANAWTISDLTGTGAKTSFTLSFENGTCATVLVEKINTGRRTDIKSRGLSTCNASSPRVVERALRVFY